MIKNFEKECVKMREAKNIEAICEKILDIMIETNDKMRPKEIRDKFSPVDRFVIRNIGNYLRILKNLDLVERFEEGTEIIEIDVNGYFGFLPQDCVVVDGTTYVKKDACRTWIETNSIKKEVPIVYYRLK